MSGRAAPVTGAAQWRGVVEEYRGWLPMAPPGPAVTLGEGGTPLVCSQWLSALTGCEVWLKVEGDNPTGSFKDRGMTLAISVAVAEGDQAVVCASTGNTSASMSAYAVRAGLRPLVLLPHARWPEARWLRLSCTARCSCSSVAGSTPASRWRAVSPPTTPSPWSTRSTRPGWRGRRRPRSRSSTRWATHRTCTSSGRQRRQHLGVLDRISRVRRCWSGHSDATDVGLSGRRRRPYRPRRAGGRPGDGCDGDPGGQPGVVAARAGRPRRVRRADPSGERRGDTRGPARSRRPRRRVRRTGISRRRRGHRGVARPGWRRGRADDRRDSHRTRPQGRRHGTAGVSRTSSTP
jgi:hypothetical protein